MPLSRTGLGRVAILLLSLGFLALLGLGFAILQQVRQTRAFTVDVSRAQEARLVALQVLSLTQDAETGQRGFLLVGEREYLEPYRAAVVALPPTLDRLDALLRREGGRAATATLRARITDKLTELAETIGLMEAGDAEGALWIVRSDRGKQIMDAVRVQVTAVEAGVTERVRDREARLAAAGERLLLGTIGALALIVGIAAVTALLGIRYTRELESAAAEVRAANEGLEARVAERTADLVAANDEIQRFAYIVSHDLRAPLVNVMGFTSELDASLATLRTQIETVETAAPALVGADTRAALDLDIPESLGFIRSSTERMDRLINAILRLSRTGSRVLAPEPIDMQALVEGIGASLTHQVDTAGADFEIEGRLPAISADRVAVEQVFGNLVDNAVKYLDAARPGRIRVRGRTVGGRGTARAVFEVEDNGRGIAPADHERIWELFRRAGRQDRPGEGIGLAHVRALVRRMGGTIGCDSTLGRGSVFRVTLPVTAERAPDTAGMSRDAGVTRG